MLIAPSSLCSCGPQASVFHLCQLRMLRTAALPLLRKGGEDDMLLHPLPDQGPEHRRDAGGLLILLRPPCKHPQTRETTPFPQEHASKNNKKNGILISDMVFVFLPDPVLIHACVCSVVPGSLQPPGTVARQAPLSMGFPRQEYWSRLPFPSPEFSSEAPPIR